MADLTKQLRDYAASIRCDLLGVAPLGRFAGMPPARHPSSMVPEAQATVVVDKRIRR